MNRLIAPSRPSFITVVLSLLLQQRPWCRAVRRDLVVDTGTLQGRRRAERGRGVDSQHSFGLLPEIVVSAFGREACGSNPHFYNFEMKSFGRLRRRRFE